MRFGLRGLVFVAIAALIAVAAVGGYVTLTPAPNWLPANLFPEATQVKVFGSEDDSFRVDGAGRVTMGVRGPDGGARKAPALGGESLTEAEVAALRAAVRYTKPPEEAEACCIPRHAFLFYGKDGRYLGYLEVCFECGCAEMEPFHLPDRRLNWIAWDHAVIARIIRAHHLQIKNYS
jgi:hypothetical protein